MLFAMVFEISFAMIPFIQGRTAKRQHRMWISITLSFPRTSECWATRATGFLPSSATEGREQKRTQNERRPRLCDGHAWQVASIMQPKRVHNETF